MARIEVHPDTVTITLSRAEKLLAMHRKDIEVNRRDIRSALITDDPWVWIRGVPSPGTHLAGKIACGVWRGLGGEDFLLVRGKKKAVVIDFAPDSKPYGRVILSTTHAADLIAALKLDELAEPHVHSTER